MVVDDEPAIGRLLCYQLRDCGYEPTYVPDGLLALQRLEREQPDLILLDVMLPTMNGWEVCRAVRACSQIPVIMLTAKSSDLDVATGLRAGADDYIAKPFSMIQVQARIEAVLRRAGKAGREARVLPPSAAPRPEAPRPTASHAPALPLAAPPAANAPTPARPVAAAPGRPAPVPRTASPAPPARIGLRLREARQARGLSLHAAERASRLRWDFLQALEQENFDYIPRPQQRVLLTAYAQFLDVDLRDLAQRQRRAHDLVVRHYAAITAAVLLLLVVGLYLL
jgi:DNA-binding response OmpR family regulator